MKKKTTKKARMKTILMDVPWDCHYGRQVRRGIYRYCRPHRPWLFVSMQTRKWLRHIDLAGVISMQRPRACAADARRRGLAAVSVGAWAPGGKLTGLPHVGVDPKALGKMAAAYFIERGFRHFGMVALDMLPHSWYRGEAFVAALRGRGLACNVFDRKKKYPSCGEPLPAVADIAEQIRRWLAPLPKPLAVFCIDDLVGLWVCGVCWRIGLHVPEEVAVLGADADDMFCDVAHPHLSSIATPAEQVGFEAARVLDTVLAGRKVPKCPVLLPPMSVVTRQSTDIMAVKDRYVADAVRFIHEHAHAGIRVENVLAEVPLSRRMLERRFKTALGRSPFAEIRRVQIENVKTLLAQTDETLEATAAKCGFDGVTRMSMAFKQAVGMPPGAYRRQFRSR